MTGPAGETPHTAAAAPLPDTGDALVQQVYALARQAEQGGLPLAEQMVVFLRAFLALLDRYALHGMDGTPLQDPLLNAYERALHGEHDPDTVHGRFATHLTLLTEYWGGGYPFPMHGLAFSALNLIDGTGGDDGGLIVTLPDRPDPDDDLAGDLHERYAALGFPPGGHT